MAITVYTVEVVFSLVLAVAPDVIEGASFTLVTVIATLFSAYNAPSEARTTISYTLFAPLSVGTSKFGEDLNVTAPVALSILNNAASTPPEME